MTIAWTTVETAIQNWIQSASGLADANVIWAGQEGKRPVGQFITMRLTTIRMIGHDWIDIVDVEDPEEGEEIEFRSKGTRTAILRIQCITGPTIGATGCLMILQKVLSALNLPSIANALDIAGIGIGIVGPILATDGVLGSNSFEPRAICDINMFFAEEVSEFGTYIESVEANGTIGPDGPGQIETTFEVELS